MLKIFRFSKKGFVLFIILLFVLAVLGGTSFYFYDQYQKSQEILKDPTIAAREEVRDLVEKVGQILELPEGEDPTVATVSDKEELSNQDFFSKAENGDKVLIYTNAKTAILFRPSTNKVINVAPVNIGTQSAAQSQPIRIAIYNGTVSPGLTNTAEIELDGKIQNIEVVAKENSEFKEYENTIVIVISEGREADAENIANELGGEVSTLPDAETAPNGADILVILGTDYVNR